MGMQGYLNRSTQQGSGTGAGPNGLGNNSLGAEKAALEAKLMAEYHVGVRVRRETGRSDARIDAAELAMVRAKVSDYRGSGTPPQRGNTGTNTGSGQNNTPPARDSGSAWAKGHNLDALTDSVGGEKTGVARNADAARGSISGATEETSNSTESAETPYSLNHQANAYRQSGDIKLNVGQEFDAIDAHQTPNDSPSPADRVRAELEKQKKAAEIAKRRAAAKAVAEAEPAHMGPSHKKISGWVWFTGEIYREFLRPLRWKIGEKLHVFWQTHGDTIKQGFVKMFNLFKKNPK